MRVTFAVLVMALLSAAPARGQEVSLGGIDAMVSEGRFQEAREALQEWWQGPRSDANRREVQWGFWLRGVLTVDPDQAALDYRRLSVEYPGGPYTDGALLRLGYGAAARGDLPDAANQFRMLARDYPSSSVQPEARRWLDRFGGDADRMAREIANRPAPVMVEDQQEEDPQAEDRQEDDQGTDEQGTDEQETESAAEPPSRTPMQAPTEIEAAPEVEAAPEAVDADLKTATHAVQIGAFASLERASRLAAQATEAGLDARLVRVPDSRLIRVRVGRFDGSAPAEDRLVEIRGLGFEATVIKDVQREIPIE